MECKNCHAPLEEDAGYCSYCGARVLKEDKITLKFIAQEILDKVLSVDNKLLKTFLHLFTKPHQVIEDYIRGVRKRYFNPFSYLLISLTLAGISTLIMKEYTIELINAANSGNISKTAEEMNKKMMDFVFDYQSFITTLSLPPYAFVSWLVFLNKKKFNYLEHHIIYLYTTAHLAILSFLVVGFCYLIDVNIFIEISLTSTVLIIIYNSYVLIRLFKLTFFQFIIKTLYFLAIGMGLYILLIIATLIVIFLLGGKEALKSLAPPPPVKDSIQKVEKQIDTLQLQPVDSLKTIQDQDSITNDPKTISYYEASSKLNCLS